MKVTIMKRYRYISALVFIFTVNQLSASANQNQAKAYFYAAEQAYESSQYTDAYNAIIKVESLLGNSNNRTTALKVKILYEQKNYMGAKEELNRFFEYNNIKPNRGKEMSSYLLKVDKAIADAPILERKAIEDEILSLYDKVQASVKSVNYRVKVIKQGKYKLFANKTITKKSLEEELTFINHCRGDSAIDKMFHPSCSITHKNINQKIKEYNQNIKLLTEYNKKMKPLIIDYTLSNLRKDTIKEHCKKSKTKITNPEVISICNT